MRQHPWHNSVFTGWWWWLWVTVTCHMVSCQKAKQRGVSRSVGRLSPKAYLGPGGRLTHPPRYSPFHLLPLYLLALSSDFHFRSWAAPASPSGTPVMPALPLPSSSRPNSPPSLPPVHGSHYLREDPEGKKAQWSHKVTRSSLRALRSYYLARCCCPDGSTVLS